MENETKKLIHKTWFIAVVFVIAIALLAVVGVLVGLNLYNQKVYPGVYLGNEKIGAKSISEIENSIKDFQQELNTQGIVFETSTSLGKKHSQKIYPVLISADSELNQEVIKIKKQETLDKIYKIGREGRIFQRLKDIFYAWKDEVRIELIAEIDSTELKSVLVDRFTSEQREYSNVSASIGEEDQIEFIAGQDGYVFDYQKAILELEKNMTEMSSEKIILDVELVKTDISLAEAKQLEPQMKELISLLPITLTYDSRTWEITKDNMREWFIFEKEDDQVVLNFDKEKTMSFLATIAAEIDREPQEPKAEFDEIRATVFQAPRDGLKLDQNDAFEKITTSFIDNSNVTIELKVNPTSPQTELNSSNVLGIKELLGVGYSNFAGSPANRRHNVATGAAAINGLLIAPGDEFSTIQVLGTIDASSGYLPELVIKEGRTIPEYGGGLCQVGTTVFRAAVNAGLEISERREHSYRVGYYEPAGTDATIYQPHPDMRFINNTGNHIVWQTYVNGDDLTFELWGVSDGRQVEVSDPVIYNISYPGPAREIETTELAPGERRKVESAHNGADAYFTRTITYPDTDKEPLEERWDSHYVAWREAWLVGIEAIEELTEETEETEEVGEDVIVYDNPFTPEDESIGEVSAE